MPRPGGFLFTLYFFRRGIGKLEVVARARRFPSVPDLARGAEFQNPAARGPAACHVDEVPPPDRPAAATPPASARAGRSAGFGAMARTRTKSRNSPHARWM